MVYYVDDYASKYLLILIKHNHVDRPEDFDPEETIGFLIATSGTTGLPKMAAATHKNFAVSSPYLW